MKENKCRVADNIVELFENTPENTRNATLKFLNGPKPPTAFLCSNDLNLKGVVDAINEKGLRIPDDISVITFDAGIYGNTYPKPITSMDTEYYKIGEAAVELLSEIKDGAVAFPVNKITEIKMTFGESVSRPGEE
jgi:LacI family transcriptional regulator